MILLWGKGILGKMKLEKLKFLPVLNFCPAEVVGILQVSGSPVFFDLPDKVSCVPHQKPPFVHTHSLALF